MIPEILITTDEFGIRFLQSKYGRPYCHKNRKALTNFRSGNKKKLRQFVK